MSDYYKTLKDEPRLLLDVDLKPLQGDRFQATGFPDIGPATYTRPDGTEMLLVESAQSMANRLEAVCWDDSSSDLVSVLQGIPYVKVDLGKGLETSSIIEAHRLNSPYILESKDTTFLDKLKKELEVFEKGPVDYSLLARILFKYDPNALLHGIFLAKKELAGGRFKMKRCLSAFIEAEDVGIAESGGVKFDRVDPSGDTQKGFGHVPYHRVEFVAGKITAYFNLDLSLLFSYGLGEDAEKLLVSLALWKIRRFLREGTRLRTACDLSPDELVASQPQGFSISTLEEIEKKIPGMIKKCGDSFAKPPVTVVKWKE